MPSGQTSYIQPMVVALPGMLANPLGGDQVIESKTVASNQAAGVPEGRGLTRVADDTVGLPAGATDITAHWQGVSVRLTAREPHNATAIVDDGTGMFIAKDQLPVLKAGNIYVLFETAAAQDDPVYCRHTVNGGLNVIGGFANAAGTGLSLVAGAKVLDTIAAPGITRARFTNPGF